MEASPSTLLSRHLKINTSRMEAGISFCPQSRLPFTKRHPCTGKHIGLILHSSFSRSLHWSFGLQLEMNCANDHLHCGRPACHPSHLCLLSGLLAQSSLPFCFHSSPSILFSTWQPEESFEKRFRYFKGHFSVGNICIQ